MTWHGLVRYQVFFLIDLMSMALENRVILAF